MDRAPGQRDELAAAAAAAPARFPPSDQQVVDVVRAPRPAGGEHGRAREARRVARDEQRRRQQRRGRRGLDRRRRHRNALPRCQELAVSSLAPEARDQLVDELLGGAGGSVDVVGEGGGELQRRWGFLGVFVGGVEEGGEGGG